MHTLINAANERIAGTTASPVHDLNVPAPCLALRPRDAARALGVSERTLWTWTERGDVPHVRLGKAVLYPIHLLQEWLAKQAQADARGREVRP